ncbi:MAG: hypothetical protein JW384_01402 [Nitrosomonadaceae bacterium]|nr:hypothetical protein [Nitrosomonadaceae bacterium]
MKYQEKGSDAPILDLFSAFNQHVNEIESAINRNELRKSIIANSLILGQATKLDETELKNGLGVLTYLSEGRRIAYKISDEVASDYERLLKVYDPAGLLRATSALNSVLKGGAVTYNPLFWLYNWAADIVTARGTVALGPIEEIQGLIEAIKDKMPFWESEISRLKVEYGGGSGYVGNRSPDQLTSEAERLGREIFGQNQNPKNIWDAVRMPAGDALATVLSWYRAIGSIPEEATRNAVFIQYLKKNNINPRELGIKAMSKEEMELITTHLRTAAMLSRRAVNDFDRAGELSRQINMVVPFFNPALQGALIPGRIMRDTFMPGATLGKTGVDRWLTLATFSATATAAGVRNMEQEEYWDIDPEERYRNLIFMLPHDRIDQNTGKKVPRYIALPTREWAMFWFPITYGIEQIYHMTHNEKGTAAYSPDVWRAITAAAPGVLPMQDVGDFIPTPLIRGMAEIAANKNFYSGAPIVPPDLKNKKLSEQWDANTPESLVRLSQYFAKDGKEISPMEMNHWVRSWTAGSGQIFLKAVDSFLDQKERTDMGGIYVLTKQLMELGDDQDARRAFFSDSHISTNDEKLIRQIEEKVLSSKGDTPLLSAVVDRFIRSRGGAKSQLGREKAAELLGVDQLQTREMGRTVAEFAQIQDQKRAALDERRKLWVGGDQENGISPKAYREQLRVLANESNGAFEKSKLDFPRSAMNDPEKWDKWLTAVSTIGGAIPEQRMRADILLQAWRTIELDDDPQTGGPDHDAFNERRRQLVAAMGGKDSADGKLFFNRLFSSMSPTQREKWDDYEKLQPYFLVKNDTFDIDPSFQTLYAELSTVAKDSKVYKDANSSEVGKLYNATLAFERDKFLRQNPDVDEKLVAWGFKAKSVQAQDEEKLNKLREKLKDSAEKVRGAEMRATAEPTTARKKAVVTADAQYEALREEIERQKQIILDPKLALTPVFPPIGNLNQTTVMELIARRNYKLPYGHDPRVDDRVDRAMETMKDTMKALTNGMYTEWDQIPDDFAILDMYERYVRTDKGRKNLAPLPTPTSKLPRPEYYIPSIPQPGVGR